MSTLQDNDLTELKRLTGRTTGTVADLEFEFLSGVSGLTEGTLADHKLAWLQAETSKTGSLNDLEWEYRETNTLTNNESIYSVVP